MLENLTSAFTGEGKIQKVVIGTHNALKILKDTITPAYNSSAGIILYLPRFYINSYSFLPLAGQDHYRLPATSLRLVHHLPHWYPTNIQAHNCTKVQEVQELWIFPDVAVGEPDYEIDSEAPD